MAAEEKKSNGLFKHMSRYVGMLSGSVAVAGGGIGRACQSGAKAAGKLFIPCKGEDEGGSPVAETPCAEPAEAAEPEDVKASESAPAEEPAKDSAEESTPEAESAPESSPEAEAEATEKPSKGGKKKTPPSL